MNDDLISRKSVLDYIEKEIATTKCTETISYLRALSVHINEYEPTAYKVDKVVKEIKNAKNENGMVIWRNDKPLMEREQAIEIVKAGGIDVR